MNAKKILVLFFTEGVSLRTWQEVGMLDREIKPYNRLAEYFEKIYFITYGDETDLKFKHLLKDNIHILPKRSSLPSKIYSLLVPFYYAKELREADFYKTNQMQAAWTAVLAKIIFRKKLIIRCGYQWSLSAIGWQMGRLKQFFVYLIELLAYRSADKVVLTTDQAKEYVIQRYKIAPAKIEVISNYIDVNLFKPLEVTKEPASIIYIGRLEEGKNLSALFEAMVGVPAKLYLIGKGVLKEQFAAYAAKHGVSAEFLGSFPNDNIPAELNKREIFILPSLYEGNPKTLLEAMACGLPVIGTRVRGIANIIKDGENGCLCDTAAASIKETIMKLLANQVLQQRIAKGARNYTVENCSLENIIIKEKQVYENFGFI